AAIFDAHLVRREPARDLLLGLVVPGEIRRDDLPALAPVGRDVHVLAAGVDLVVVPGRDRERRVPDEAVLEVRCRPAAGRERVHLDVLPLTIALVVADDDAAATARPARRGPDDVGVHGIRRRKARLAAEDAVPPTAGDAAAR